MVALEDFWADRNRTPIQIFSGALIAAIALVDWWTKPYVSLGFLYLFPIMFVAAFLPRWAVVLLAAGCAWLAEIFSALEPSFVRLSFEILALAGCGLFVSELVRNRRITQETETRLRALVGTSPAAILIVDQSGFIELGNQSAADLLEPRNGELAGCPVAAFLPELHHALRWEEAPQFRSSLRCNGRRGNEESFTADVWLSTWKHGAERKLAAIIVNVEEECAAPVASVGAQIAVNDRESSVLGFVMQGLANKEIAARMDVSEGTVKNTLQQLFARTRVRTRAQLVRIAFELQAHAEASKVTVLSRRSVMPEARRMLPRRRFAS
jgi:DNA-binding CsgD family transcriptional regulator